MKANVAFLLTSWYLDAFFVRLIRKTKLVRLIQFAAWLSFHDSTNVDDHSKQYFVRK